MHQAVTPLWTGLCLALLSSFWWHCDWKSLIYDGLT